MTEKIAPAPPPDDELIVGIVAALGINLEEVTAELRAVLSEFGYRSHDLHLTDAFKDFRWSPPLIETPFDERVWSYMDAGDTLCRKWKRKDTSGTKIIGNDAMAMLAVLQIGVAREDVTHNPDLPAARTAYVVRSLKRPEEVELLRAVYGRRFFLIGVATDEAARLRYLNLDPPLLGGVPSGAGI
jgi:hypothetical protein